MITKTHPGKVYLEIGSKKQVIFKHYISLILSGLNLRVQRYPPGYKAGLC